MICVTNKMIVVTNRVTYLLSCTVGHYNR